MKHIVLIFALMIGLAACSSNDQPEYQEQAYVGAPAAPDGMMPPPGMEYAQPEEREPPKVGGSVGNFFFKPHTLPSDPPDGPPEYQQGWVDGCESGMHSYTNSLAKTVKAYSMKQDPNLVNNNVYYQVWKDAFLYCAIYMEATNKWAL